MKSFAYIINIDNTFFFKTNIYNIKEENITNNL